MNARGIPPTAQQVFAVLICPGGGGGVPPGRRATYPGRGVPTPPPPHLDLARVGTPRLDLARVGTSLPPSGPGQGRYPPPPSGVNRQTPVKAIPSPLPSDADGNYE